MNTHQMGVKLFHADRWTVRRDEVNHLKPNDHYMGRTAQLTSRCYILYIFIQQIYVLNILNTLHNLRFFLFKIPFIT